MPAPHPVISIVVPSLNQGRFIADCLQSILDQGHKDTQIIVIDGGSTDETLDVLKRFQDHLHHWVSEADLGQSDALNKGFVVASGDIVTWQNADDFYLPGAFDAVIEGFTRHPDAALVYGDWIEVDEHRTELVRWHAFKFSDRSVRYGGTNAIAQAMFWRRDVHERFGEFPRQLHQVMDHYLTMRIGLNEGYGSFARIDMPLMAFRRHSQQKTGHLDDGRVQSEIAEMDRLLGIRRRRGLTGLLLRFGYRTLRGIRYWQAGGTRYMISRVRERF